MRLQITFALALTIVSGQAYAAESPQAFKRWAVLSAPSIREMGLAEMVLADLAAMPAMELVERDQIEAATRELVFSDVLGSAGVKNRLALGRILRADVLVLLEMERTPGAADGEKEQQSLRLVISECAQGARLHVERIPLAKPAEAAERTVAAVKQTRDRFSGGIRCVVGVSPFVSRTLVHDYDYLQSALAYVLQNALASVPGTAVIEVEEAQAIRRERGVAEGAEARRLVPLLVEGEYRVENGAATSPARMSLHIRFTDGQKTIHSLDRESVVFGEAAGILRTEGVRWAAELAGGVNSSLSVDDQIGFMIRQAGGFAALGAYVHAAGLREACLLLKPELVEQHFAAAKEYALLLSRLPAHRHERLEAAEESAWIDSAYAYLRLCLDHLEYLIRDPKYPESRIADVCWDLYSAEPPQLRASEEGKRRLAELENVRRRFILDIYPLLLRKSTPDKWQSLLGDWINREWNPWAPASGQLELLHELLLHRIPPEHSINSGFADCISRICGTWWQTGEDRRPRAQLAAFLNDLRDSGIPRNILLARFASLCYDVNRMDMLREIPPEGVLTAARDLIADAESAEVLGIAQQTQRLIDCLTELKQGGRSPQTVTARPPGWAGATGVKPPASAPAAVQVNVHRVPFQLRDRAGAIRRLLEKRWSNSNMQLPALSIRRCGDALDVFWSESVILFHRTPGLLEEILVAPDGDFDDVLWDGQRVWLGTLHHGIQIVDPAAGKVVATIGPEHGLPPSDQGIKLHQLPSGQILAAGSFGENTRAWLALVDGSAGSPQVRVFHEATQTGGSGTDGRRGGETDPRSVFIPAWIMTYPTQWGGQGDRILVGRRSAYEEPGDVMVSSGSNLEVDLRALTVSVAKGLPMMQYCGSGGFYVLPGGEAIEASPDLRILAAPGRQLEPALSRMQFRPSKSFSQQTLIVPYQGYLYLPGYTWHRLDPRTLTQEILVLHPPPDAGQRDESLIQRGFSAHPQVFEYGFRANAGVSAHYGLLEWSERHEFFRYEIPDSEGRGR